VYCCKKRGHIKPLKISYHQFCIKRIVLLILGINILFLFTAQAQNEIKGPLNTIHYTMSETLIEIRLNERSPIENNIYSSECAFPTKLKLNDSVHTEAKL